jgi:hypothetical protein
MIWIINGNTMLNSRFLLSAAFMVRVINGYTMPFSWYSWISWALPLHFWGALFIRFAADIPVFLNHDIITPISLNCFTDILAVFVISKLSRKLESALK